MKLNTPNVDMWCDLGTCSLCRFVFQEKCHVARSGWFMSFQCLGLLPINSAIPLLPSYISHIFSSNICHLVPRLGVFFSVFSHPRLEPSILFSLFLGFSLEFFF